MKHRPRVDVGDASNIWTICGQVMDALEKFDGDRRRANTFFTEFMKTKDDADGLAATIENYVVVEGF